MTFPPDLRDFVGREKWTFAKTYVKWPREYIVRDRVDEALFVQVVEHIRAHGYEGRFYRMSITYFDEGGMAEFLSEEDKEGMVFQSVYAVDSEAEQRRVRQEQALVAIGYLSPEEGHVDLRHPGGREVLGKADGCTHPTLRLLKRREG